MSRKLSPRPLSAKPSPPDIVTYRYEGEMVYVPPAQNHQDAIRLARSEFGEPLRHVFDRQISFSVNSVVHHETRSVRISPLSWPTVMSTLSRYEIIDVIVQPCIDVDCPPEYPVTQDEKSDLKSSVYLEPPSPKSSRRSLSRSPSPDHDGTVETSKTRSWFGKLKP
ncbi:hypothetical protein OE88DRAFT_1808611 [Heliocybe sulcata]|uniref:Uncharacterized protein n=1 Tax=Heliocybe sulcata TaxID=5364 RepID=A0A5C3N4Q7_9AGAM|nr:hypothetical protein OE88DRAFT_1808611 [Heliocybe sulcata]